GRQVRVPERPGDGGGVGAEVAAEDGGEDGRPRARRDGDEDGVLEPLADLVEEVPVARAALEEVVPRLDLLPPAGEAGERLEREARGEQPGRFERVGGGVEGGAGRDANAALAVVRRRVRRPG